MNGTKEVCFLDGCNKKARNKNGPCEMHYYRKRRNGSYSLSSHQDSKSKKLEFEVKNAGCYEVTSHYELSNGYVLITTKGKRLLAHRFIYTQCFGEIPKGLIVRHKCDNRKCINPEHLLLGTHQDNMNDAKERNRLAYGEGHSNNKNSVSTITKIIKMISEGKRNVDIAEKLNVKTSLVTDVKTGRSWGWLKRSLSD